MKSYIKAYVYIYGNKVRKHKVILSSFGNINIYNVCETTKEKSQ